ncbi:hypothetical protein AB4K20DRAFT_1978142 [Rhizopus microsporus]
MAKKEIITKGSYQQKELHSEEMSIALTSIITNIKNMWNDNTIFKKTSRSSFECFIKITLGWKQEKSKSTTVATSSLNKLERELESLDDDEDKRQRFERRITRGHDRITYLKSLPKKTVLRMKPARNIKMMPVEAVCLVYNQLDDIQRELPDTTEKEVQTQMLIAQTLQPYIPDKQNRFVVARQIPLCILANDILRTTGYAKFTRQLFPLPRLSYLNALQANAPSLYHMMTSGPDALLISDFNQKAIDSIEYARSNKHAVFSSIFDMSEITNTCDSYKLKFAYNIQILPGLKTARILGTTTKEHSDLSLKKSLSYTLRIVQDPNILQKSDHEVVLGAKIKQLKDRFKSLLTIDERESMWHDMKCLKEEDNQLSQLCIKLKTGLISQKKKKKKIAVRFDKAIQEQAKRSGQEKKKDDLIKINSQTTGVFNTTDCLIDGANDFTFSGTDNGLINLSRSVPFTSQQFQFHIQLYNRYHVLQEPDVDIKDEETTFLNLLQSKTINANEIDINYMHRKNRKHLGRLKKKTSQGEEVSTLEAKLEKASLSASSNVEEFQQNYHVHEDCSKKLRSFYSTQERESLTKANTGSDKKQLHGKHVNVCITNEHMTSQTCIYCYQKLCHPKAMLTKKNKQVSQEIKGALMCVNPKCMAVKSGRSTKSRDALSSLAIGLSGLAQCLIGSPLPPFAQFQISQFNTDTVNKLSWSFVSARDHLTSTLCAHTIVVPYEG